MTFGDPRRRAKVDYKALNVDYGVDPSAAALERAQRRGTAAIAGIAETLPLRDGAVGGALIAFTLCFVSSPLTSLKEAHRVLIPGGGVVLGLLLTERRGRTRTRAEARRAIRFTAARSSIR